MKNKNVTAMIRAGVAVLLVVFAVWFGVSAYLTDAEKTTNVISYGDNETRVNEDFEPPEELKKGTNTYKKSISVSNIGKTEAFVRVLVKFSDDSVAKMSGASPDGTHFYSVLEDGMPENTPEESVTGINKSPFISHLPEGWVYVPFDDATAVNYEDPYFELDTTKGELLGGYFYYKSPLSVGETTTRLTNKFTTYFAKESDVVPYDIIVYEESIDTYDYLGQEYTGTNAWMQAWIQFLARKSENKN